VEDIRKRKMVKEKAKKEMEEAKVSKDIGECKDKKCPFHGSLSVRGRYFKGIVKKILGKLAVIEFERLIYYPKYERFAKAKTKLHAYLPDCMKKTIVVGDLVKIRECRPISKIMNFIVVERIK